MNLWIFPGQPLAPEKTIPFDPDMQEIIEICRENCSYDLVRNVPVGSSFISPHTCLQIYGVAQSIYHSRRILKNAGKPDLIASHSLGIYAALAAAGSIDEAAALRLVAEIGNCMYECFRDREYALGCAIGISVSDVEKAAACNGVYMANYNTSRHFLLSGEKPGVELAMLQCKADCAFSTTLFQCEAPLHTPLIHEIEADLEKIISKFDFAEPDVPLADNLAQGYLNRHSIPLFLVEELKSPVCWEKTWLALRSRGIGKVTEVGSGRALAKFNRWIDSEGYQ